LSCIFVQTNNEKKKPYPAPTSDRAEVDGNKQYARNKQRLIKDAYPSIQLPLTPIVQKFQVADKESFARR